MLRQGSLGNINIVPIRLSFRKNTKLDSIIAPMALMMLIGGKLDHIYLKRNVTYMNNASLGMPPAVVVNAVRDGYKAISKNHSWKT
ncbi:MAG: hypothetical protein CM1200mP1_10410 [Candidatus Neomarinimicrobiota bacterium]|nr:MAG: hypothetical protein CM1200mP1_10410 [Candidatus Neomarinimicrobiota bacterium]